ncbi:hypothetical protein NB717_003797 [Xanthomonas sacchari]|nr:hypothetical protein [Xanthomonas sacchari]
MTGDLPPSSRVTGVSCRAAAAITSRPTAAEPVKNTWSNGQASKACAVAAPPCTRATSSGANASSSTACSTALTCGVNSEGLISAVLPAASADTNGPSTVATG